MLDTRLVYGAATWPCPTGSDIAIIDAARIQHQRTALTLHSVAKGAADRTTDHDVWVASAMAPTALRVAVERLRYFPRFLRHAPPALRALVQVAAAERGSWASQVLEAMQLLHDRVGDRYGALPPPSASTAPWEEEAMERPFKWRAALAKLVRTAPAGPVREGPSEGPGEVPVVAEGWHHCLLCPAVLSSAARLKIHAYRVHQVKHVLRSFTFSGSCHNVREDVLDA